MAIIELKAWYLETYKPIREVIKRPHDLRLSKNSLLKSGLRADFLDEREQVKDSQWFQRYLEGENVEFYIEGSGGYAISNIDLISHEIYFTKQELTAMLEPIIFFSHQQEFCPSSEAITSVLTQVVESRNQSSLFPLRLERAQRPLDAPLRLSDNQLRKIRKSLFFVADVTSIGKIEGETTSLLSSPNVCVEIGYALQCKRAGQILLVNMERPELIGKFPFDLPQHQQLTFKDESELTQTLPLVIDNILQIFKL